MPLAVFFNLVGPDLIIIAIIIAVLAVPFLIALIIVLIVMRKGRKPPPLPKT